MRYGDHSDAELVRQAQDGWAPAFAVLVHRHAPTLRAALAGDDDPLGAVIEVFVRTMRRLDRLDPDQPVLPWLLGLAGAEPPSREAVTPLSQEEEDEVWAELALRWPNGRLPVRVPRGVRLTALAAALVLLAALIPTVLLADNGRDEDETQVLDELQAFPLEEELDEEEEVEDDEPDEDEGFDFEGLPTFEFPEEEAIVDEPDEEPATDEVEQDAPADEEPAEEEEEPDAPDDQADEESLPEDQDDGGDDEDDEDDEGDADTETEAAEAEE